MATPRNGEFQASPSENRLKIFDLVLGDLGEDLPPNLKKAMLSSATHPIEEPPVNGQNDAAVRRAKLVNVVADAANDNVELSTRILQDANVSTSRDVALHYGFSRVRSLAAGMITDQKTISKEDTAKTERDAVSAFALNFRRHLFKIEPTAVLQQMIASSNEEENPSDQLPIHSSPGVRREVANILQSQSEFNIRKTSVLVILRDDVLSAEDRDIRLQQGVTESLKLLQRVQALTPVPDAIKPLLQEGMTTALRVSSLPKKRFLQRIIPRLTEVIGSEEEAQQIARRIHDHGMASRARADHALLQIRHTVKGSGLTVVDGNSSLVDRSDMFNQLASEAAGAQGVVKLDDLFGDMDFCECDECLDVTSPTAYFVDLLQYLRNNNLDLASEWPNTGQEGYANTALEKLFLRRPDLQHLKLTCENANTLLPLIDISNEIMESFVIHLAEYTREPIPHKQAILETWNVDNEKPTELLASPSHTQKAAYWILKDATCPIASLPYFQPLDAMRLYLQHLGTSRFEIISILRLAHRQWIVKDAFLDTPQKAAQFASLRGQLQDRATAAEFLSLTPDEYVILTKESLWPIESSMFADDGSLLSVEKYREQIGVRATHEYWNYDSPQMLLSMKETARVGLAFVKLQFLPRSGLSYAETADLVRTYFVNPMLPSGNDKALYRSVSFLYRFLQYPLLETTDIARRNRDITSFLSHTQPWMSEIVSELTPPTANKPEKSKEVSVFTEKEIQAWISRWFDRVGKLVVLYSDEGPTLPVEGYLVWIPPVAKSSLARHHSAAAVANSPTATKTESAAKVLGYIDKRGELRDNGKNLIGFVWLNGQVFYQGLRPIRQIYLDGDLILTQGPPKALDVGSNPLPPSVGKPARVNAESFLEYVPQTDQDHPILVTWLIPNDSCSIEKTKIVHLNGTALELWEWDRINRFIRLYRKLRPAGWTIPQLDAALKALWKVPEAGIASPSTESPSLVATPSTTDEYNQEEGRAFSFLNYQDKGSDSGVDESAENDAGELTVGPRVEVPPGDPGIYADITPGFLKELMSIKQLVDSTGLELERLLCLWSTISTFGDNSLYARLFLTHDLESMDQVFQPHENGNYFTSEPKIGDHVPALVAALQLKTGAFDNVLQHAGLARDSLITLPNLTKLYRYVVLSKVLGTNMSTLLDALDLFVEPFTSASRTLDIYLLWSRMLKAGFTVRQLRYIIINRDDPLRPIGLDKAKMLQTTKSILDALLTINRDHPDLSPQQEAGITASEVKAKATLILAPSVVDDIMGLIEGTKLYTTNAPTGLRIDTTNLSPKIVYKDSQTSGNRRATLSVTGNLTEAELAVAASIFPSNKSWQSALERLKKQSVSLVMNTVSEIFPERIDKAIEALTQGDVPADLGNVGTAVTKRLYFMKAFLPFVRSYLSTKIIVTTMASVTSLSLETCALLLNDIIKIGPEGAKVSAMQILTDLTRHLSSDPSGTWQGFIVPPSTDTYVFYGYGNTQPQPLVLDGQSVPFATQNEDPSDLWWTNAIRLTGGTLHSLAVAGQNIPGDLQWKTARSAIVTVPASSLIPDASVTDAEAIFAQISRASIIIQAFTLEASEIAYLQSYGQAFASLDFNSVTLDGWKRLLAYFELRNSLPRREISLVDLFKWADLTDKTSADELSKMLSAVTAFDQGTIKILIDRKNLDLVDPKLFQNELALSRLTNAIALLQKTRIVDVEMLLSWTDLKLDFNPTWETAKSIRSAIRSKYSVEDFEQAIKPTHDQLRKNQRDALIAYHLVLPSVQKWGVTDSDGLFEFFLIDVQMGSCMETSRIKQAISSVQLFVQRCMLGLEEKENFGVANDALDAERWKWMSKQNLWAANRNAFLRPENWLIPSLRDDKTPIYEATEAEILQDDISPSNVLESFKDYVTGLGQVAQLRAVGLFVDVKETEVKEPIQRVLHCIAMTRGSPYLFYYRTFNLTLRVWEPWSQITLDIPTYTQEWDLRIGSGDASPVTTETTTGCYAVPVAWKSRVFLFIGQLNRKIAENDKATDMPFKDFTGPNSGITARTIAPEKVWEVKVAFSEYLSGHWTQKAVSAESFLTNGSLDVDSFQFMPRIVKPRVGDEYVSIEIRQNFKTDIIGNYLFNGSFLQKGGSTNGKALASSRLTSFHWVNGRSPNPVVSSLQQSADGSTLPFFNKAPFISYTGQTDLNGMITYPDSTRDLFYHPFSNDLLSAATSATDIKPILKVFTGIRDVLSGPAFGLVTKQAEGDNQSNSTYSELSCPYSIYNWELGFHYPMQIADALLSNQLFDRALEMIHHVFNPYADGPTARRVWQWPPFKESDARRVLESILDRLKPREFDLEVTRWRDHPFQPHVVARGRIVAYMKWTVMMYIRTLIAYGDYYFRRRTLEDIPLATQCYILASHMYGPQGEEIPKRGKKGAQTYFSLLNNWDAFSNAVVQLELAFPFSNITPFPATGPADAGTDEDIVLANVFGFAASSYFCVPNNPELRRLRNTIDQRLFNIRHCLDINGRPMPLALWEPPLDPGELVKSVGAGLSLSSALNDLSATLPNYRFSWLFSHAIELCGELKSLENAFQVIKEKRDAEALQRLRHSHEIATHGRTLEMKKVQLQEANNTLAALRVNQESPKQRYTFYARLTGADVHPLSPNLNEPFKPFDLTIETPTTEGDLHLSKAEKEEIDQSREAKFFNSISAGDEVLASILQAYPGLSVHSTPMGCGMEVQYGSANIAAPIQTHARIMQIISNDHSFKSTRADRKGMNIRQYQERILQMNLAGWEYEHLKAMITAQQDRVQLATTDIDHQEKEIKNANDLDEFLHNKYTNDDLYNYLESSTRQTMYQTYLLAYDLAKKAELAFRFERKTDPAQTTSFISFGYFDQARDGLQSGQQLYLALKNLEKAYQTERAYDYELSKSVSLRQLNPYALLELRESGTCTIDIPEVLFDMDFPGHYFRRIKTIALTIPCVVGPYTGVNATLRLKSHRYRWDPLASNGKDYLERMEGRLDARFRTEYIPVDSVASSSGQNDHGVFELSLRDERYLPFEGAGAISSWQLQLPPASFRPFDYGSINDVVLGMRYTACEGGEPLRRAAAESVMDFVATVEGYSQTQGLLSIFDIKSEFATEWVKLSDSVSSAEVRTLILKGLNMRLPAFTRGRATSHIRATDVSLLTTLPLAISDLALDLSYTAPTAPGGGRDNETPFDSGPRKIGSLNLFRISEADNPVGDWALKVKLAPGLQADPATKMWMIIRYRLLKTG